MARYVIWGTGRQARIILNIYMSGYFDRNHRILYFVDNDPNKWGKFFRLTDLESREICAPSRLWQKEFDKILICSGSAAVIREELIFQYDVEPSQIVFEEDIQRDIYREYVISQNIRNESVLVVGADKLLSVFWKETYKSYFYGAIDVETVDDLPSVKGKNYKYILMTHVALDYKIRGKGRIQCERNIIEMIMKKMHVPRTRILTYGDIGAMESFLSYESWGDENEEKDFLVIHPSGGVGLAAIMNAVLKACDAARSMGCIPVVDMRYNWSAYLKPEEFGVVNIWEKFFEQPAGYTAEDISHSKNIWVANEMNVLRALHGMMAFDKEFEQYIHPKADLEAFAQSWMECLLPKDGRILAVVYRGSDYRSKKAYAHYIQPDIMEYIRVIDEKQQEWGRVYDRIFLATDSREAVGFFKEKYGDKLVYVSKERVSDYAEGYVQQEFAKLGDLCESAKSYYTEMRIAASCDDLISGICSAYNTIRWMNGGRFGHVYTFYLGQYGIDDESEL